MVRAKVIKVKMEFRKVAGAVAGCHTSDMKPCTSTHAGFDDFEKVTSIPFNSESKLRKEQPCSPFILLLTEVSP